MGINDERIRAEVEKDRVILIKYKDGRNIDREDWPILDKFENSCIFGDIIQIAFVRGQQESQASLTFYGREFMGLTN